MSAGRDVDFRAASHFGRWLSRQRKARDLTQQDLAERLGCSMWAIQKMEAGSRRPSKQLVELLADFFQIPPDERADFLSFARGRTDAAGAAGEIPGSQDLGVDHEGEEGKAPASASSAYPHAQTDSSDQGQYRKSGEGSSPNNLPVQLTSFVGRYIELPRVRDLMLTADVRLLTLTGAPGTGKTRLAVEVASNLLSDFQDGVYFVNLAPVTDPGLLAAEIAQTLGVGENPGQSLIQAVISSINSQRLLLVLDNFEQILEAAPVVGQLLVACPRLRVMVTSRAPLQIRGEKEFSVPPLYLPDLQHLPALEGLSRYEAVRLFIERARHVLGDFTLTADNARAVAEICVRLDGLPLAIELAAARARTLPPQAMLSRLKNRLAFLAGRVRDVATRQQTLRSTIDWSYNLLGEPYRQLFRRLAPFRGGRTLQAIEAVCNYDGRLGIDVLDGVEVLLSNSLLQQREGSDCEPRFWMLETIHEYATEKLHQSGEEEEMRKQHALYFLWLAQEAGPQTTGPRQAEWLDRLEEEHDDLRAALEWSEAASGGTDDPDRLEIGLQLVGALFKFWNIRGHFTEGREWSARMLAHPASLAPTALGARAGALNTAGALAWNQSDMAEARLSYEESLQIWQQLGDKGDRVQVNYALTGLGLVSWQQGDFAAAIAFHEQALAIARELGNAERVAVALLNLGDVLISEGEYERARELLEESLRLSRAIDDKRTLGMELLMMGIIARSVELMKRDKRDHRQAKALFEESLATYRAIGEKRWSLYNTYELGQVAYAEGDYPQAAEMFRQSLEGGHTLGDKTVIALSLGGLGLVAYTQSNPERAALLLGASSAIFAAIGSQEFPIEHASFERGEEVVNAQLGEERWRNVWQEGRSMGMKQAIEYALDQAALVVTDH